MTGRAGQIGKHRLDDTPHSFLIRGNRHNGLGMLDHPCGGLSGCAGRGERIVAVKSPGEVCAVE